MTNKLTSSGFFNSIQLLQAYEQAIDKNIISSITDTQGIIVYANKKFCEISKFDLPELIGKSHNIVNSGYHSKDFFRIMWQTIAKGNTWHEEVKNKDKNGIFYWVDTVIVPIKDTEDKISNYLSLRTLITDKKLLEIKKAKYVNSLESILVMTSSKVKNPLAICLKQINAFNPEKQNGKVEMKQIMDDLKESVSDLDSFTNELTSYIRDLEL
ncbi:MAG: PAS domain S-box protein [Opitutaceae bacterium]|nr:PAS domain S-box protein [Cytophagales bacterium]